MGDTIYNDPGNYEKGHRRRYWPPGMDYPRWRDLPAEQRRQFHNRMCEYQGTSADGWGGFADVRAMIAESFPMNLAGPALDVACSTGVWLVHLLDAGIADVHGVDISEWATANPLRPELDGRLHCGDFAADPLPADWPESFALVTAFDFLEHVFEVDVPAVVDRLAEVCRGGRAAFVVCTSNPTAPAEEWSAEKGPWAGEPHLDDRGKLIEWVEQLGAVDVPPEREWQAVSGHVTIRPHSWWAEQLAAAGFHVRWDAMHRFEQARRERPGFCYGMAPSTVHPEGGNPYKFPGGLVDQVASWGPRFLFLCDGPKRKGRKRKAKR